MKSKILLILCMLLSSNIIYGQSSDKFMDNIYAGLTFGDSKFTSDNTSNDAANYQPALGFMIGIGKNYPLSKAIDFEVAFGFVNMGMKIADQDYTYSLSYLSVEGLARYTFSNSMFINGGIYLDYGLFGKQTTPSGNSIKPFEKGAISRSNSGLEMGLGYPLSLSGKPVEISLSYRLGLNDVEGKFDQDNQRATFQMTSLGIKLLL